MSLVRLKDEYLEQQDGVRFLMADELGNTVACKVSHEALRAQAERVHFSGSDSAVFQAYRELIEELASDALMLRGLSTIMAACWSPQRRSPGSRAAPSSISPRYGLSPANSSFCNITEAGGCCYGPEKASARRLKCTIFLERAHSFSSLFRHGRSGLVSSG